MTTTKYAGNFIYEQASGGEELKFFNHPEGYVQPNGTGGFDYVYQYKDHLGNVRLSYSDSNGNGDIDASTEIVEENNYYPFGLEHKGYNNVVNGTENKYLTYNGKEFDESLNLNTFDLGARHMDPALGRFMVIDPMADFFNNQSPYAVANNNPVGNVDYYGFGIWNWLKALVNKTGNAIGKLFSGNNCSCKGNGESLAQAFRRPDNIFPKRKKRRRGKVTKQTTPSGLVRRPKVRAVPGLSQEGIADFGNPDINVSLTLRQPTPPTPVVKPPVRRRVVDEVEENVGAPIIDVNFNIPFTPSTTYLKDEAGAIKILSDLIKTLKEYPQMKVIVEGTLGASNLPGTPTLKTRVKVNGGAGPAEWLTGGRANAIIKILKGQGVNAEQLIKGKGIIGTNTNVVIKSKSD